MLHMRFIREHAKEVEENLKRRNDPELIEMLHELLELDKRWRALDKEINQLRKERNKMAEYIEKLKMQNKPIEEQIKKARALPKKIAELEKEAKALKDRIRILQLNIPNMLHESVPYGRDENDNVEVERWGKPKKPEFELLHHGKLAQQLELADFARAVKISGAGFYFLKNELVLLELALIRFALDELAKKGYTLLTPPLLMRRRPYEGCVSLEDFENVMYKVENEDLYLIATAEHPIAAMYMNEILEEKDLPIKYCALSQCFRREIGKHSVDERGLFRVHQFNKVEQFIFCKPEDSWQYHEELINNTKELFKKLEIPFRVVNVCTGDLGKIAAKKYDLEIWSPREQKYIEAASCSNCTSYQAVRLNIKFRRGQEKEYVHTLNSTAIATPRTMRVILETYQRKDLRIEVPKVLRPYMNGISCIPSKE